MSIRAWWASKIAMAQASDLNKQKIEESATAKIVAENDLAMRSAVKKSEELGVSNDVVKLHLKTNWWDDTPAEPASTEVNWVELVKAMTPKQKAELKKLLG